MVLMTDKAVEIVARLQMDSFKCYYIFNHVLEW